MRQALILCFLPWLQEPQRLEETRPDGTHVEREVVPGPGGELVNQGSYKESWPDGSPRVEGRFQQGARVGSWRSWHASGAQASRGSYQRGLRRGAWKVWREDGSVVEEESGKFEPFESDWPAGTPRVRGETREGRRHGNWTLYWDNGCEQASGHYLDDQASGAWFFRHPQGTFDPDWISGLYERGQRIAPLPEEARLGVAARTLPPPPAAGSRAERALELLERWRRADERTRAAALEELTRAAADPVILSELLVQLGGAQSGPGQPEDVQPGEPVAPPSPEEAGLARSLLENRLDREPERAWMPPGPDADAQALAIERLRWASLLRLAADPETRWLRLSPLHREAVVRIQREHLQPAPLEAFYHPPLLDDFSGDPVARLADTPYASRFAARDRGPRREALDRALAWLEQHQSVGGGWDADGFMESCGQIGAGACDGPGAPTVDVGVTALALLAFLGDGHTPRDGEHRETVARGLHWLLEQQNPETGMIGERTTTAWIYSHGAATLALCEALALADSPPLRLAAQRAVKLIERTRNPYSGWRYDLIPAGESDTSVTGWMVSALAAARRAGVSADYSLAFEGALALLDALTDPAVGRTGYESMGENSARTPANDHYPRELGEALSASCLLSRLELGQSRSEPILLKQAALIATKPPRWDPQGFGCDMYYWFHASQALHQMGKPYEGPWQKAMTEVAVDAQRQDADSAGSWDPVGPWGYEGGRVYSTALMTLCLEAPTRLDPPRTTRR